LIDRYLDNPLRALQAMPFTDKLTQLYNGRGFVRASEYLLARSNGPMPCAMLLAIEVGNLKVIEHALARAKKNKAKG
jgi:GGDEF domain-containing protein